MPVDPGFAAHGHVVLVDREHAAHAAHVQLQPAERDGLSLGREPAAAHGHRDAMLLRGSHDLGHHLGRARDQHAARQAVGHAPRVRNVQCARGLLLVDDDALGRKIGHKGLPAVAFPAGRVGLLARYADERVRGHRARGDDAGACGFDVEGFMLEVVIHVNEVLYTFSRRLLHNF